MVHQVGGTNHGGKKQTVLTLEPDYILKPLQQDHRGFREVAFYEAIYFASKRSSLASFLMAAGQSREPSTQLSQSRKALDIISMWLAMRIQDPVVASSEEAMVKSWRAVKEETEILKQLSKWIPAYYGVVDYPLEPPRRRHILLQDITANFLQPCVMDIKMGTVTFEPDATLEKKQRELKKYEEQSTFGFRIVGMQKFDPSSSDANEDGYVTYGKEHGRSLKTTSSLIQALRLFFRDSSGDVPKIKTRCLANVNMQLRLIKQWFDSSNTLLQFYASSILIVYEGNDPSSKLASVKMVDFGHVRRKAGGDPGYQHGLHTLMALFDEILRQENARKFV